MADGNILNVEARDETGSSKVRRLRAAGKVPAVYYGPGIESQSLSLTVEEINKVVQSGNRAVQLQGAAQGDAHVQDVQWNTFGTKVLHVDLVPAAVASQQ